MACLLLIPVLLISIGYQPKSSFKGSLNLLVFPGSSAGKESACNAGDPSLSPGLGRSSGEGIGYPLQYPRAFLVAQRVKNLPAMWQTWVQPLGWEDPLEKSMATHSSILSWTTPMDSGAWQATIHGVARVGHDLAVKPPPSILKVAWVLQFDFLLVYE